MAMPITKYIDIKRLIAIQKLMVQVLDALILENALP